jgi:hypothetical protein
MKVESTRKRDGAPLTDKLLSAVARHLNDDHLEDLLACAKASGGCDWAEQAKVLNLEATGIELEVARDRRVEAIRLDFPETARGVLSLRDTLATLIGDSRRQLGWAEAVDED